VNDFDSRYWIDGEGISSRDHTDQGEETTKETIVGFQLIEARGKSYVVQRLSYNIFLCVRGLQWRHEHIHG
jgi:hypothetical protein